MVTYFEHLNARKGFIRIAKKGFIRGRLVCFKQEVRQQTAAILITVHCLAKNELIIQPSF